MPLALLRRAKLDHILFLACSCDAGTRSSMTAERALHGREQNINCVIL
jgi:hypothetical protein